METRLDAVLMPQIPININNMEPCNLVNSPETAGETLSLIK